MALARKHYALDYPTVLATAAITGGRFVKQTGTWTDGTNVSAAHAGVGDVPFGVAGHDIASGAIGQAYGLSGVVTVEAGATLAQGDQIKVGAAGVAAVATAGTDFAIGVVMRGAASGALALVRLFPAPIKTS